MKRGASAWLVDFSARHAVAWLFAAPVALLFMQTAAPDASAAGTMLYTALALLAMSACFWNRWCVLGTLAILSISLFAFRKPIQDLLPDIADFLGWAGLHVTGWQPMNTYYEQAFQWCACGAISAGVWLTALRFRFPIAALGIFAAVAGHAYFFGAPDLIAWSVPVLAGLYLVSIQTPARESRRIRVARPALPRSVLALTAIPLALLIAWLPFAVLPEDTSRLRSPTVIGWIDDLADRLRFNFGGPAAREGFSIEAFGYYPDQGRLGGTANPSSQPVMAVTAARAALLKCTVLDNYLGDRWTVSAAHDDHRLDGLFPQQSGVLEDAFSLDLPDAGRWPAESLDGLFHDTLTFEYRMLTNTGSMLFSQGRLLSLEPDDRGGLIPYFNDAGEIFAQRSLRVRDAYRLDARVLRTSDPAFPELISDVVADHDTRRMSVSSTIPDQTDAVYLALPDSLPESIRTLSQEITAGQDNPYAAALSIRHYLQETCSYSLTVADVPPGIDFVQWFLDTKVGYCTYFATAMTVMARCAGVPARYVEGFSMSYERARELDDGLLQFRVTGRDAHAWCEVYVRGAGWIPIDATPGFDQPAPGPGPDETVTPRPDPITEIPSDSTPMPTGTPVTVKPEVDTVVFRIALSVLVAAVAAFAVWALYRRRLHWYDVERAKRRLGSGARVMEAYWRVSTGLLSGIGFKAVPSDTPHVYAARVANDTGTWKTGDIAEGLRWLAGCHVAVTYGGLEPQDDELARADGIRKDVLRAYIVRRGRLRYWLFDVPSGRLQRD